MANDVSGTEKPPQWHYNTVDLLTRSPVSPFGLKLQTTSSNEFNFQFQISESDDFNTLKIDTVVSYGNIQTALQLYFNHTYFTRVRKIHKTNAEITAWSDTIKFTTSNVIIGRLDVRYDTLNTSRLPVIFNPPTLVTSGLVYEVLLDSTPQFNRSTTTKYFLPLDSINKNPFYCKWNKQRNYVKIRGIYYGDTLDWNPTNSLYFDVQNKLMTRTSLSDSMMRFTVHHWHGLAQNSTRYRLYEDETRNVLLLDSFEESTFALSFDLSSCDSFFLDAISISNTVELKYSGWISTCEIFQYSSPLLDSDTVKIYNYLDHWIVEIDTSLTFNSTEKQTIVCQRSNGNRWLNCPFELNANSCTYFMRYKVSQYGVYWTDWIRTTQLIAPVILIEGFTDWENKDKLEPIIQIISSPPKSLGIQFQQYELDSSIEFNSTNRISFTESVNTNQDSSLTRRPLFNDPYFIRMRYACPDGSFTSWSNITTKHVRTNPEFQKPVNQDQINYHPRVTPYSQFTKLHYQYSATPDFISESTFSVYGADHPNLEFGKSHYIRVRFEHEFDTSSWNQPLLFTTHNNTTHIIHPEKKHPLDGEIVQPKQINLKWEFQFQDNADDYYLMVYQDQAVTGDLVYFFPVRDSSHIIPRLPSGHDYFWTVISTSDNSDLKQPEITYHQLKTSGSLHVDATEIQEHFPYPNPSSGVVFFNNIFAKSEGNYTYQLIDQLGIIQSEGLFETDSNPVMLDFRDNMDGVYQLRLIDANGIFANHRILIVH